MSLPTHTYNGRSYEVLAKFYGPTRTDKANAYMAKTPGACVLCDDASRETVVLTHYHDKGVPVEPEDSDFDTKGWVQMVRVNS